MLKILQQILDVFHLVMLDSLWPNGLHTKLGFNSMWTKKLHMYKLGFEEVEEPEDKLPIFVDHGESKEIPK